MANLRGTTYKELDKVLGTRYSIKIGNNTQAIRMTNNGVAVTLHGNKIVELSEDGSVAVTLAGWGSVTTRERVNQFLPTGYRIFQKDYDQYLSKPDGTVEGISSSEWIFIPQLTRPARMIFNGRRTTSV